MQGDYEWLELYYLYAYITSRFGLRKILALDCLFAQCVHKLTEPLYFVCNIALENPQIAV
jgi:hypothetical protein